MTQQGGRWPTLDEIVEAFESAQARGGRADLAEFAPTADHPGYLAILCELIRVDLEYGWRRGRLDPLDGYRERFPDVFRDPRLAGEIAFEASRLRRQAEEDEAALGDDVGDADDLFDLPDGIGGDGGGGGLAKAATVYRSYRLGRDADPGGLDALFASRRVPPEPARLFRELHDSDPLLADRLARAATSMPPPGTDFLGFRLEEELGRGAFGRVYLARQGDLANRPVALKISADVAGETNTLAQLQHTNIVPIYSVHRRGPLQAVCMPYLGATTLADVLGELKSHETLPDSGEGLLRSRAHQVRSSVAREGESDGEAGAASTEAAPGDGQGPDVAPTAIRATAQAQHLRGLGYVEAILWMVSRIADGLAHAHERGILHRDLKPANVLFSDDAEPLLLDFNLAADTKPGGAASAALIGGTLPYMAPEHLDAFRGKARDVDARSDLYSLGVILFELLTRRHPFEVRKGRVEEVLPRMVADRLGPIPDPRRWNGQVTPAVASIVRKCLAPDPARRYPSARALQDDLARQLDDLPLKHAPDPSPRERLGKWARRHPRLTSSTTVGVVAVWLIAAVVAGFSARQVRLARLEAADSYHRLSEDVQRADALLGTRDADPGQRAEGLDLCNRALRRYRVLDDQSWATRPTVVSLPVGDRNGLRREVGWLSLLYARAVAWQAEEATDPVRRSERVRLASRVGTLAETCFEREEAPRALWLQKAELARISGRPDEAKRLRARADSIPVRSPRDASWRLADRLDRGDRRGLLPEIKQTSFSGSQDFSTWFRMGQSCAALGDYNGAVMCYDSSIALRPELPWTYFNRGLAHLDLKKHAEARADFDAVLARRPDLAAAYLNRALARFHLEDFAGAVADLGRALERPDAPTRALFLRARARDRLGDRDGATRDREEGLRRLPNDESSWIARGVARLPADPRGALADFDAALALAPRSRAALENKASVLAEHFGRIEEAVGVLDEAVRSDPDYVRALAGRGVLLARLGRRDDALRDARSALDRSDEAATLYQVAGIYALTSAQAPEDRVRAIRLLADALRKDPSWLRVVPADRDLDPVRDRPEFRELLRALDVVYRPEASAASPLNGGPR